MIKAVIPFKLPSLNEYINECRANRFAGANLKREVENSIAPYLKRLPKFNNPVKISFYWIEDNKRRDLDNICFAKKFILDALVKLGKLKDDNRKCVTEFRDVFSYSATAKILLIIEEVK